MTSTNRTDAPPPPRAKALAIMSFRRKLHAIYALGYALCCVVFIAVMIRLVHLGLRATTSASCSWRRRW